MPTFSEVATQLRGHFINITHHANTKAFTNAFFPALGTACGWALPALVVGLVVL